MCGVLDVHLNRVWSVEVEVVVVFDQQDVLFVLIIIRHVLRSLSIATL